jgi:thymidylate kinase
VILCALSGVDGAGKSTFADAIEAELRSRDVRAARLWLRYNPRPDAGGAQSTVSEGHRGHPLKHLARRGGLRRVWVAANIARYRHQLRLQLAGARDLDVVVADRYVVDFFADLAAASMVKVDEMGRLVGRLPSAELTLVLDADDDELIRRTKSGDEVERVVSRAALYRRIARATGALLIDTRSPDALAEVCERIQLAAGA